MAQTQRLFHESWHRIANARLSLRASVTVQRQLYRGEIWYLVQDPFNTNFYRLRSEAYQFVARLDSRKTIETIWNETLAADPDHAPGQSDVLELLAQLYNANLLHGDLPYNSGRLFERYRKKKQRILRSNLLNIMFFRIPLLDPEDLLKRLSTVVHFLFGPLGIALWVIVVGFGVKLAVENFDALTEQSQGILAPSNLLLLYLGLVIIKALHEFGHSFAVKRFGGEVHVMGVMFLIFSPLPYMDATAAWAFRSKWQRVLVGMSGVIFEVFIAAIAVMIWAATGEGVVHSLMYNMLFIASVSTLIFNINPLLRYDGYYVLADILDYPNLHQKANQQLSWLVETHAFGRKGVEPPAQSVREAFGLSFFGIASGFYRIIVFSSILLFVADRFLMAGLIMAGIMGISWLLVPLLKFIKYLSTSRRLDRIRLRTVSVCAATGVALFGLLYVCPFPRFFKAPGVLKAVDYVVAVNQTPGIVSAIHEASGARVKKEAALITLENPELENQLRETRSALDESQIRFQKAMWEQSSDMAPIQSRTQAYQARLERLLRDKAELVVRAPFDGIWVSPAITDFRGMFMPRGSTIGQVVNDRRFQFVSVINQSDASELFTGAVKGTRVKLFGQLDKELRVSSFASIPMEHTDLPSAALGWAGGGDIAIDMSDQSGAKSAEPFYEVRAEIERAGSALLLHGRGGKIRFSLPSEGLLKQGWRRLRQLIQKRYQL